MTHKQIARITDTRLGYEDHGIFTVMLSVDYGGSSQTIGTHALDNPGKPRRTGTAYGHEYIIRVLRACGVQTWEKVKGRTIYVLRASDAWGAQVLGIENLPFENGEPFVFADLEPS